MPLDELDDIFSHSNLEVLNQAAVKLSTTPGLYIALARMLYTRFTQNSALTSAGFAKYVRMCDLFKRCTQPNVDTILNGTVIPFGWKLDDDHRPLYSVSFDTRVSQLGTAISDLNDGECVLKTQIVTMLGIIERLFESLSSRTISANYSTCGNEVMFYDEFIMWLVVDLPRSNISQQSTAEMVRRRVEYCTEIKKQVFVQIGSTDISNPTNQLELIIRELNAMYLNLCQAYQAASFASVVGSIQSNLTNMVVNNFRFLYAILPTVDRAFNVDEFLTLPIGSSLKVGVLAQYLMGKWITSTLVLNGIKDASYTSPNPMSLDAINEHIPFPCDLETLTFAEIGLYDFMLDSLRPQHEPVVICSYHMVNSLANGVVNGARNAANSIHNAVSSSEDELRLRYLAGAGRIFLEAIINIHRSIARITWVKHALKIIDTLSATYGDVWLFADEVGSGILIRLMAVLADVCEKDRVALIKINDLLNPIINNSAFSTKYNNNRIYTNMMEAQRHIQGSIINPKGKIALVAESMAVINAMRNRHSSTMSSSVEAQLKLIIMLNEYSPLVQLAPLAVFNINPRGVIYMPGENEVVTTAGAAAAATAGVAATAAAAAEAPVVQIYTTAELSVAYAVQKIFDDARNHPERAITPSVLALGCRFNNPFHVSIANNVLKPHTWYVEHWFLAGCFYGYIGKKIDILHKYQSLFSRALTKAGELTREESKFFDLQLAIIDKILHANLNQMHEDISWHIEARLAYSTERTGKEAETDVLSPLTMEGGFLAMNDAFKAIVATRPGDIALVNTLRKQLADEQAKTAAAEARAVAAEARAKAEEDAHERTKVNLEEYRAQVIARDLQLANTATQLATSRNETTKLQGDTLTLQASLALAIGALNAVTARAASSPTVSSTATATVRAAAAPTASSTIAAPVKAASSSSTPITPIVTAARAAPPALPSRPTSSSAPAPRA